MNSYQLRIVGEMIRLRIELEHLTEADENAGMPEEFIRYRVCHLKRRLAALARKLKRRS